MGRRVEREGRRVGRWKGRGLKLFRREER